MATIRVPFPLAAVLRSRMATAWSRVGGRRAGPRPDAALRALRASESRYRTMVTNSSGVILLLGADGTVEFATPALTRVLGRLPEAVVGRPVTDLVDRADVAALERSLVAWRSAPGVGATVSLTWRCADGGQVSGETIAVNLLDDPAVGALMLSTRDVSERRALEQRLSHQARHDALTGLPNRRSFEEAVDELTCDRRRAGDAIGIVFVDIDGFKAVNDTLGHPVGDGVLHEAGARIVGATRADDLAARLSGDEFAVLVTGSDAARGARATAVRVEQAFAAPFRVLGHELAVTASIGVAVADADLGGAADVLRHADLAMYEAKADGGGRSITFSKDLGTVVARRLRLETALAEAIEDHHVTVAYQPVVALDTGRTSGFEALARWDHPELGAVTPAEFIPIAERSGLIVALGRAVLGQACADLATWRALPGWGSLKVGVNLSVRQLAHVDIVRDVRGALEAAGLPPDALLLELTESILMEHAETLSERLRQVRAIGVGLALDDFGTGYSALAYLRRFPVDVLKLDRSFIEGLADDPFGAALVKGVLDLTAGLGIDTVAEGIERPRDVDLLRELGCGNGQGFLLSRPVPAAEVPGLLAPGRGSRAARTGVPLPVG